jgi:hypothetical protein
MFRVPPATSVSLNSRQPVGNRACICEPGDAVLGHEPTAGVSDRVGDGLADRPVRTCERCWDERDLRDDVLGVGVPVSAALRAVTCKVTALAARRSWRSQASRDQSGQLQLVPHRSLSQHGNDSQPWPPAHLGNRVEQDALIARPGWKEFHGRPTQRGRRTPTD